jgi:hypothetical protein
MQYALNWVESHEVMITAFTLGSILVFTVTLILIPWLIIQMPADYFSKPPGDRRLSQGNNLVVSTAINILRNLLGVSLILVGLLLLVLPGQGLLTIILGCLLTQIPGKRRLINWLVQKKSIQRSINWIRRQAGKEDIELKPLTDESQ